MTLVFAWCCLGLAVWLVLDKGRGSSILGNLSMGLLTAGLLAAIAVVHLLDLGVGKRETRSFE